MQIFEYAKQHPDALLAVTDQHEEILCQELLTLSAQFAKQVGHRLVFVLCQNTPGAILGYLGLLHAGAVSLLLDANLDPLLLENLIRIYQPAFLYAPADRETSLLPFVTNVSGTDSPAATVHTGPTAAVDSTSTDNVPAMLFREYALYATGTDGPPLHEDLALLLTTSGSTGSPKLVRLSRENLDSNTVSIAEYLKITEKERPITMLPLQYSYGMSVINSHVLRGAPLMITAHTMFDPAFWARVQYDGVTSLCGIPYTYTMLRRIGLTTMDLPALKTLTQAGGKLPVELHREFAEWAARTGRDFIVMYGQTEASPRMAYLPADKALEKAGSTGIPIPGGELWLENADGTRIQTPHASGELVYKGKNVALGYAVCAEDLQKGDEWHGVLHTGDLAAFDEDHFYYIVGRKERFVKITGKRVNLDDVERLLRLKEDLTFACVGRDDSLTIYVENGNVKAKTGDPEAGDTAIPDPETADTGTPDLESTVNLDPETAEALSAFLYEKTGIPEKMIHIRFLPQLPRKSSGKTSYSELEIL